MTPIEEKLETFSDKSSQCWPSAWAAMYAREVRRPILPTEVDGWVFVLQEYITWWINSGSGQLKCITVSEAFCLMHPLAKA